MSFEMISDPITTIFTDIINSSFSTGVFLDLENYAVVKLSMKADKDRDEISSHKALNNTVFLSKVPKTACLRQLNYHLSRMPALQNLQSA